MVCLNLLKRGIYKTKRPTFSTVSRVDSKPAAIDLDYTHCIKYCYVSPGGRTAMMSSYTKPPSLNDKAD